MDLARLEAGLINAAILHAAGGEWETNV